MVGRACATIPQSKKTFEKLCAIFEETFILKDLKDQAQQTVYSLSMDQFNGNFDQYSTAFRLAQAHSKINLDSILTNWLAAMMTITTLPEGQEKTGWKWEQ